jgi:hypothetical protein
MRCDACSCIYLDESDYNKHMRNFHRQDSPKKHRYAMQNVTFIVQQLCTGLLQCCMPYGQLADGHTLAIPVPLPTSYNRTAIQWYCGI